MVKARSHGHTYLQVGLGNAVLVRAQEDEKMGLGEHLAFSIMTLLAELNGYPPLKWFN